MCQKSSGQVSTISVIRRWLALLLVILIIIGIITELFFPQTIPPEMLLIIMRLLEIVSLF